MTLELRGVSKVVEGQTHIHETDLTLEAATMNVLLGPTSAGKTTLMRLMAGLDAPTTGSVHWRGEDVTGMRVQDRKVAMVYQQFINYPSLTVYENIASPLRLSGTPKDEIDRKVRETAKLVKLNDRQLGRKPLELSGGQQQRCALARALVKNAGLVLLDEPLANLDYKLREELREEIPKIFEESGAIFVYATTEPHEALLLGGRVACLWQGRVTQFGPTPKVYRAPADATTARVFSDPPMNFFDVRKAEGRLSFGEDVQMDVPSGFSGMADGDYLAGIRPNHLKIERDSAASVGLPATVVGSEITGSETFIHLDHDGRRWVAIAHGVQDIEAGSKREVYADPSHIFMFSASDERLAAAGGAAA